MAWEIKGCLHGLSSTPEKPKGNFFPLPGEKENGHNFICDALDRGQWFTLEAEQLHRFKNCSFPPENQ